MAHTKKEFSVYELNLVAEWKLNTKNNSCICTRDLCAPTQHELESGNFVLKAIKGDCGHGFHLECIEKFTKSNSAICPICKTPWVGQIALDTKTQSHSQQGVKVVQQH